MPAVRPTCHRPALAALLMAASAPAIAQDAETRVPVNLTEAGCDPTAISVPAGPVVLELTNGGGDVAEFEILKGDFVVDEAENIVPGFQNDLVTRLDGGEYTTVCYSLQSPARHAVRDRRCAAATPALHGRGCRHAGRVPDRVRDLRPGAGDRGRDPGRAPSRRRSRPATWTPHGRCTHRRACRGRPSSPSRSCSRTSTMPSTSGRRTSRASTTRPGPGSTASSGSCGSTTLPGDLDALADGLLAECERTGEPPRDPAHRRVHHGPGRRRAHRGGRPDQDDRRGGPLLGHRPLVHRGQYRGLAADRGHLRPTLAVGRARLPRSAGCGVRGVDTIIDRYRDGDGFRPFGDITPADATALQAALAGLAEVLSRLAGTLGLTA